MLHRDDWAFLADPAGCRAYCADTTPAGPLRADELPPYLDALADPSMPRMARRIVAYALVPALRADQAGTVGRLTEWARGLPAERRADVLHPLLRAVGLRAGDEGGGEFDRDLWPTIGIARAQEAAEPELRAFAWILRQGRTWPSESRPEVRRLCSALADRLSPLPVAIYPSDCCDTFSDVVGPWILNLAGADQEELDAFECRVRAGSDLVLTEVLKALPLVAEVDTLRGCGLFCDLVNLQAENPRRAWTFIFPDVFRVLLEKVPTGALGAVFVAYAFLAPARPSAEEEATSAIAASLDLPPESGAEESSSWGVLSTPDGDRRRFAVVHRGEFEAVRGTRPDAALERPGVAAFPQDFEEAVARWLAEGDLARTRSALGVLLRENVLRAFWEAALHLLARFPGELAVQLGVLLNDVGILVDSSLTRPCRDAIRAALPFLSDRRRDALEDIVEQLPGLCGHLEESIPYYQAILAQAIREAGVPRRPARRALQEILAAPDFAARTRIPEPTGFLGSPAWSPEAKAAPDLAPDGTGFDGQFEGLFRFARDYRRDESQATEAHMVVVRLVELMPHWRGFDLPRRGILRDAVLAALSAPGGTFTEPELTTLQAVLVEWAEAGDGDPARPESGEDARLTRSAAARGLILRFQHEVAGEALKAEALRVFEKLIADPSAEVRHAAAKELARLEVSPLTAPLWRRGAREAGESDQVETVEVLVIALALMPEPPAELGFPIVAEFLRRPVRWFRRHAESGPAEVDAAEWTPLQEWRGARAVRMLAELLVRFAARGSEPASRRLIEAFAPEAANDPLDSTLAAGSGWCLTKFAGEESERLRPVAAALLASPRDEDLRVTPRSLHRYFPRDVEKHLGLAERMLAVASEGAEDRRNRPERMCLLEAAREMLTPLWTRTDPPLSPSQRRRLVACTDVLIEAPNYDLAVWRDWMGMLGEPDRKEP